MIGTDIVNSQKKYELKENSNEPEILEQTENSENSHRPHKNKRSKKNSSQDIQDHEANYERSFISRDALNSKN